MESFSFWKLIGGFFPTSGKNTAKLIFYVVIFSACMFVYNKWIAPMLNTKDTTTIQAEKVTVNQCEKIQTFGIQIGKIGLGGWLR